MKYQRHWATATVLPDGDVMVSGGSRENNGNGGYVTNIEIWNPDTGQWTTLREAAAARGKYVGTALDLDALHDDETYASILAEEFDELTAENAMKWEPLAPTADTYDWVDADETRRRLADAGVEIPDAAAPAPAPVPAEPPFTEPIPVLA